MGNIFCNYRFFEEGGLIQAEKITMPTNFYQFFFLSQTCSYSAKRIPERIILDLKQIDICNYISNLNKITRNRKHEISKIYYAISDKITISADQLNSYSWLLKVKFFETVKRIEQIKNLQRNSFSDSIRACLENVDEERNKREFNVSEKILTGFLKKEIRNNKIMLLYLSEFEQLFVAKFSKFQLEFDSVKKEAFKKKFKRHLHTIREILFNMTIHFYHQFFNFVLVKSKDFSQIFGKLSLFIDDLIFSSNFSFYSLSMTLIDKIYDRKVLIGCSERKIIPQILNTSNIFPTQENIRKILEKLEEMKYQPNPRRKFDILTRTKNLIIKIANDNAISPGNRRINADGLIYAFCLVLQQVEDHEIWREFHFMEEFLEEWVREKDEKNYFYCSFRIALASLLEENGESL